MTLYSDFLDSSLGINSEHWDAAYIHSISPHASVSGTTTFSGILTDITSIAFDTTATGVPPHQEGLIFWDSDSKCLAYYNEQNDITVQLSQESLMRVVNKSGAEITNGKAVYVSGAQGNRPTIDLCDADSHLDMHRLIGLTTNTIPNNTNGYVCVRGLVHELNTSSWVEGTILYVDDTGNGTLTSIRPPAPKHAVCVGMVIAQDATNGIICVGPRFGTETYELHDVTSTEPTSDGQVLMWSTASGTYLLDNTLYTHANSPHADIVWTLSGTNTYYNGGNIGIGTNNPTHTLEVVGTFSVSGTSNWSGSLIPSADNTYDLGTPTKQWKSLYITGGSVYMNGVKVLESTEPTITFSADNNQNMSIQARGSGDMEFVTDLGNIEMKGNVEILASKKIITSDTNALDIGQDLYVEGDITLDGTVDGRDIASDGSSLDTLITTVGNHTSSINTLNGYVDQGLTNTDTPEFAGVGIGTDSPSTELDVIGDSYISGNLSVGGNVTVTGTLTYQNTQTIQLEDNIIVVNYGETGVGVTTGSGGIEVDRGTLTNYQFMFRESDDAFVIGEVGDLQTVATREDSPTNSGIPYWNSTANRLDTKADFVYKGGRLGIGQTSPGAQLHIYGNLGTSYSGIDNSKALPDGLAIRLQNINNIDGATSQIQFATHNQAGSNQEAYIAAISNSTGSSPDIAIGNRTGSSSFVENFRFTSDGKVGIGTTTPYRILELETDKPITRQSDNSATTASGAIGYNEYGYTVDSTYTRMGWVGCGSRYDEDLSITNQTTTGGLSFRTNSTEVVKITNDGKVGIGTTDPQWNIELHGSDTSMTGRIINEDATGESQWSAAIDGDANYQIKIHGSQRTNSIINDIPAAGKMQIRQGTSSGTGMVIQTSNSNSPIYFLTDNTARGIINTNGDYGIGTTSPSFRLDVQDTVVSGSAVIGLKNNASPDVNNRTSLYKVLKTTAGNRVVCHIRSSFTNITDGNRESLVEFITADNGNLDTNVVIKGKNLGIGTTAPPDQLTVADGNISLLSDSINDVRFGDSGGADYFRFKYGGGATGTMSMQTYDSGWQDRIYIEKAGNIGIGTTSPEAKLHVIGYTLISGSAYVIGTVDEANYYNSTGLSVYGRTGLNYPATMSGFNDNLAKDHALYITNSKADSYNNIVSIGFGVQTPGVTSNAAIGCFSSAAGTSDIVFQVEDNNVSLEAMRINHNGYVGIGTSDFSEAYKFIVDGKKDSAKFSNPGDILIMVHNTASDHRLKLRAGGAANGWVEGVQIGSESNSPVTFTVDNSPVMTLISGSVGIGTTNPEAKLDIAISDGAAYSNTDSGLDSYFPLSTDALQIKNQADGSGAPIGIHMEAATVGGETGQRIVRLEAVPVSGNYKTDLVFKTRGAGGNIDERVRITNAGYLGVGTTNPSYKLQINDETMSTNPSSADVAVNLNIDSSEGDTLVISNGGTDPNTTPRPAGIHFKSPTYGATGAYSSGRIVSYFDTTGGSNPGWAGTVLALQYATTADNTFATGLALRNGKVGIGVDNPNGKLHIYTGDSGAAPSSSYDDIFIENNGHAGITIAGSTTSSCGIAFADSGGNSRGFVGYSHNSDILQFNAAGTNYMNLTSAGYLGIGLIDPDSLLHVGSRDGSTTTTYVTIEGYRASAGATIGGIKIQNKDSVEYDAAYILSKNDGGVDDGDLEFYVNSNGSSSATIASPSMILSSDGVLSLPNMPSGSTQAGAGVSAGQLWRTASHSTLPDGVVMIGI